MSIWRLMAENSLEELQHMREDYIKKYIGDFNKPWDYSDELKQLGKLIKLKS